MIGTSEGTVLLSRNNNTQGVLVHKADSDNFVSLYICKANRFETVEVINNELDQIKVFVTIGMNDFNLEFTLRDTSKSFVLKNHYVYSGEEIWVSTNRPYNYAVAGYVGFAT